MRSTRRPSTAARLRLIGALFCSLLVTVLAGFTGPADAAAHTITLCGHNQHRVVRGPHGQSYLLRNPYWLGTGRACVSTDGRPEFTVTRTPRAAGDVTAYPDLVWGCMWGACSTHRPRLPIALHQVREMRSTLHVKDSGVPGTWNASYDLWITRKPTTTRRRNGAELMIWLNQHGRCCRLAGDARKVHLDHHWWWRTHWRMHDSIHNASWNYIQYRLIHPRPKVNGLNLAAFIRDSQRVRQTRPSWYLDSVGAGFEIWSGGVGLTVSKFGVHMRTRRSARTLTAVG